MTEMTRWENGGEAVAATLNAGAMSLVQWAQEADAAYTLAQKLTSTAFCPKQFQGKPADAAAAMLAGGEVGLSPLTSLRSFHVIQGTAAPAAITLRALVQSRGHEIVLVESTATRAKMKGKRRGSPEWQTVTWTIDRAKDLGLLGKNPNWKSQPQAMLVARATSEVARLIASDAVLGIGYTAEELADGTTGPAVFTDDVEVAPAPAKRTLRREKPAVMEVTPDPDEPAALADVPDGDGPDPLSDKTRGHLFALLNEAGIIDPDVQRQGMSKILGREVESRSTLTEDEGRALIVELEARAAEQQQGGEES